MLNGFNDYITKNDLLKKEDSTLITVSGGRDSVVLCELFDNAGLKFAIAHCNFQLRGKEAGGDELFVKKLAAKYKVDFFVKRFDTAAFSKANKLSIQETARVLRYQWFEEVRKKQGFDYVATAHHKDDELETFFINLLRGTGIAGLHGIAAKRGNIIRPLLFAGRNEIDAFVKKNKLKFREDSSNASEKYVRNKIRHAILPLFEEINPSFRKTLANEITRLGSVEKIYLDFIETNSKKLLKNNSISIQELKKSPYPSVLLYELLKKYHFNAEVSDEVFSALDALPGKLFYSATHRLVKDRAMLIITERKVDNNSDNVAISQHLKSISTPLEMTFSKVRNTADFKIPKDNNIACLDHEKLKFPLTVRKWEQGDFFYPLGMNKKKKLSDFFADIKLSIPDKENVWLVCSGPDIVYVAGKRIDERYKVGKETKLIYLVQCIDKNV